MNVVVLSGRLTRAPEERVLPSGDRLVALEMSVARPGERADSVPVVWRDPQASAMALQAGDTLVVVGRVRRRFFRAGGGTGSRTEVVADSVVPSRQAKRAAAALAAASAQIAAA